MKRKQKLKKLFNCKAGISYLQIIILVIAIFAFCYIISSSTENVSAQIVGNYVCCEKTKKGNYCQFVQEEQCDSNFQTAPTQCENTDFCKLGCCYDQETGLCSKGSSKGSCEGLWFPDSFCNILECQRGCCILGRNSIWTTKRNCEIESKFLGLKTDFRQDVDSEVKCIFLSEKDDEGACVYGDREKICKRTTREKCKDLEGYFYKNVFCSDPALNTGCTKHDHVKCADNENNDGKSVYWFDSCGNKEDIKEECNIFKGTICSLVDGDYKCKSLDCEVEINGKIVKKKNGESWCEYDGTIGNGRDVVGSRHIRHICFMGEERVEPCEDYRNQICVQNDVKLENGETFSEAACRINNWRSCLDYNIMEDTEKAKEKCEENPDCFIKRVAIADHFTFDFCSPKYPPGFNIKNEGGRKNAEMICGMASQKCTVIYVKKLRGWKCKVNCACEKSEFAQQMNDLCTSLGDCGSYVNYIGEITEDGYSVKGAPKLSNTFLNKLKAYAEAKPEQKAEPGNLSFLGSWTTLESEKYEEKRGKSYVGAGLGMMGVGLLVNKVFATSLVSTAGAQLGTTSPEFASLPLSQRDLVTVAGNPSLQAFGNALAAAGAILATSSIISKALGLNGEASKILSYVGLSLTLHATSTAFSGGATSGLMDALLGFDFKLLGRILGPYVVVLLIVASVLKVLGIGKTKKKIVEFKCLPWQPPAGGKNCNKCNTDNPLGVPCSEYRCKSLGQTCELINKGTEHQMCIDNSPNDVTSPKIEPLYGVITEGYEYYNIKDDGFEVAEQGGGCIPEFTQVTFGIETDKPSQCKISDDPLKSYDEMEEFFGGSNLYLTNHTTSLNLPSPSAFKNQYNLTDKQIKELGEINFYVKCKSVNGIANTNPYVIRTCVKPGPDLTAPRITRTEPTNGAYLAYNQTKQDLQIWTNEPASCKYDINNKDYEDMENLMNCQIDIEDYELYGWQCNTTLNVFENNKFYIKCKDQPWLPEDNESRNIMGESYIYELKRSESELKIDKVLPSEDIIGGFEPLTVNLEVFTSGGAENGKATCEYSLDGYNYIRFFDTDSNYHQQVFSQITRGHYKIYIKCQDAAGNIAENYTEFNVKIDTSSPIITRAYYDGELIIMTDEPAICAYSLTNNKCNFDIENSTEANLMSGEGKEHTVKQSVESVYYVKCKDKYGNQPGKCSIIVRLAV